MNEEHVYDDVAVDSGRLLIIDPCYLPDEIQGEIKALIEKGLALMVSTPYGDGWHSVFEIGNQLHIVPEIAVLAEEPLELEGKWKFINE